MKNLRLDRWIGVSNLVFLSLNLGIEAVAPGDIGDKIQISLLVVYLIYMVPAIIQYRRRKKEETHEEDRRLRLLELMRLYPNMEFTELLKASEK